MLLSNARLPVGKTVAALLFCFALVSVSCSGSSDEVAAADPTAVPEPTAVPAPTAAPEPTAVPEPTAAPEPAAAQESDAGDSADEAAAAFALTEMATFFGFDGAEAEAAASCMTEVITDGGITVEEAVTSGATLTAALNCGADPTVIFGTIDQVDTLGTDLTEADVQCAFDAMIGLLTDVPIAEAGDLFSGSGPPPEISDAMITTCGISTADAQALLR